MRWQFWKKPDLPILPRVREVRESAKPLKRSTFILAVVGFASATCFSAVGSHDSRISAESSDRAAKSAQQSADASTSALNVTIQPTLALDCVFESADLTRKALSQQVVCIAPRGVNASSIQQNWVGIASSPKFDMVADQDAWLCGLHNHSRLPLLNVTLRFPIQVAEAVSIYNAPNYVVCLHEIPVIRSEGTFHFVLVNGSSQKVMLFAPVPSRVTVPSLGRRLAPVTPVNLEEPQQEFVFSVLLPGPEARFIAAAPISRYERLHCGGGQDSQDDRIRHMQETLNLYED